MATNTCSVGIPTCSGDKHFFLSAPWTHPWRPYRTHSKGRATQHWRRFGKTHVEADTQNWRRYPEAAPQVQMCCFSAQNGTCIQHFRCFASTHNGTVIRIFGCSSSAHTSASAQHWRCFASPESGEGGSDLELAPSGSLAQVEKAPSGSLAQVEKENLQVEKQEPAYVGRALRAGKGAAIAELLQIFGNLLERPFGGGECVAKAGAVVIERIVSDAQALRGQEGVSDQIIFEMLKVIRLLEMDMDLVRAARKEETLHERLESAKKHCRQACIIASSF